MQSVSEGSSSNSSNSSNSSSSSSSSNNNSNSNSSSRGLGSSNISGSSSGRSSCNSARGSSGRPILLITLLIATATATAAAGATSAATVSFVPSAASTNGDETLAASSIDDSGRLQQTQRMHATYHEIPRLKLYKACGLPLVMLLARKCSRRGGVYLLETDPRFALMVSKQRERQNNTRTVTHVKLAKISISSRHLCFRRNYGMKNPFLDCCCNYCTERTVLGYCRSSSRPALSFSSRVSG